MDEKTASRYASGIIAVGTGSDSVYVPNEINICKNIIEYIKKKANHKATANISSILNKLSITHTESDLDLISKKIEALIN